METSELAGQRVRLGDVAEVTKGLSYQGQHLTDEGAPLVNLKCIAPGGGFRPGGLKPYSGPFKERHSVEPGDLVVANTDLTQDGGIIGSPAVVPDLGGESAAGLISHHLCRIRPRPGSSVDTSFLYFLLKGPWFKAYARSVASGTTVLGFRTPDIENFEFELPPVATQHAIARTLGSFDELIENNRRRITLVGNIADLLYRQWFVLFRFPGHPADNLIDSRLGPIPGGWAVTTLAEEAHLVRPSIRPADSPDEVFAHYSIPAFDEGRLPTRDLGSEVRSGKYLIEESVVLLSKLNPRFPRVWAVEPSCEVRSICSTEFLPLAPNAGWPLVFLRSALSDGGFGARLAGIASGTSTSHQRAKPADVMALALLKPPRDLVLEYSERVGPMFELEESLIRENQVLEGVRDLLLPRVVSGQVGITRASSAAA